MHVNLSLIKMEKNYTLCPLQKHSIALMGNNYTGTRKSVVVHNIVHYELSRRILIPANLPGTFCCCCLSIIINYYAHYQAVYKMYFKKRFSCRLF